MKRALDVLGAALGLVLLAPLLALVAVLVGFTLGRPVLFRQLRAGLHGKPFLLIKFRTMRDTRLTDGSLAPDHMRLTPLGRFLRSSSLDELPELWNVLRGEMSLVGPRPLRIEYLPLYTEKQSRRHDVLPGITGWAQVHGRNAVSWEERFQRDLWYVENGSLAVDLRILFLTLWRVIRREGISQEGHATMPPFRGTPTTGSGTE